MNKSMLLTHILSIETVNPEGGKLLVVILIIFGAISILLLVNSKALRKTTVFKRRLKLTLKKNKRYKPQSITIAVHNPSKQVVTINAPILRFKRFKTTKAYRITAVKSLQLYPINIEGGKSHNITVLLAPFYQHERRLKKFPRLRVELSDHFNRNYKTGYTLLKSTLFKKAK